MSSHENISEYGDIELLPYPSGEISPSEVAVQTATALDLYFSYDIPDKSLTQQFFRDETLPFLRGAQHGFLHNIRKVDPLGLASENDMEMIKRRRSNKTVRPLEQESFDYTLVILNALPDFAQHSALKKGFSRRGLLSPPETVRQFMQRIDEMGVQMTQIVSGDISPETPIELNPALWRTKLFFEVGSEMPQYYKDNPYIIRQKSRDILHRLLQDLNL